MTRHGKEFCSSCADEVLFQAPLVGSVAGLPLSPSQGAMDALAGVRVAFEMVKTMQSPPSGELSPGERQALVDAGYGTMEGAGPEPTGTDWRNLPILAREYAPDYEPPGPSGEEDIADKLVAEALKKK